MNLVRKIIYWSKPLIGIRRHTRIGLLVQWLVLFSVVTSCESNPYGAHWFDEDNLTIGQYLEKNQKEYSKFYKLLAEGNLLSTLKAYNPHGDGYTLFLPTDEAIDHFLLQNQEYGNFEALLQDTGFVRTLTRYHTLNRKVHTDEFPDGALNDRTLTGDRLVTGFFLNGDNQLIKVNNVAPIIKSNLDMTNGYIDVISGVLQQVKISGYDWLQQQADYSILAKAMELSGISGRLRFNNYTILAENDSIYHRKGIFTIEDLINRVATPGIPYSNTSNAFYQFAAYHILSGEYYLNDFDFGSKNYQTLGKNQLTIDVGFDIRINPGVDTLGINISDSGDTTVIDYISPVWDDCNILTGTGPVHSISDVLDSQPLP